MFIKKSAFFEAGGFDPFFFAHQEEIDLCWRLQLMGKKIMACPASIVYHIGGGTLPKNNPQKVFLNFRNNLIMLYKNRSGFERCYILSIRFALDAVSAWKNILSGQQSYFIAVMKSHFAFIGWWVSHQKKSVFPSVRSGKIQGLFNGNVVWEHFIRGKKTFAEIVN
jgi:GT2 family glycosyltransferase